MGSPWASPYRRDRLAWRTGEPHLDQPVHSPHGAAPPTRCAGPGCAADPGRHRGAAARRRVGARDADAAAQLQAGVRRRHVGVAGRAHRSRRLPRRHPQRPIPTALDTAARAAAVREAAEEAGIVVDPDTLVWFSHWTPPPIAPKRFGTWFFAAPAPAGEITIDGGEIHDHAWMAPGRGHAPAQRPRDRAVAAHLDHPRAAGRVLLGGRDHGRAVRPDRPSTSPPASPRSRVARWPSTTATRATTTRSPTAPAAATVCGCSTPAGATNAQPDLRLTAADREHRARRGVPVVPVVCTTPDLVGGHIGGHAAAVGPGLVAHPHPVARRRPAGLVHQAQVVPAHHRRRVVAAGEHLRPHHRRGQRRARRPTGRAPTVVIPERQVGDRAAPGRRARRAGPGGRSVDRVDPADGQAVGHPRRPGQVPGVRVVAGRWAGWPPSPTAHDRRRRSRPSSPPSTPGGRGATAAPGGRLRRRDHDR